MKYSTKICCFLIIFLLIVNICYSTGYITEEEMIAEALGFIYGQDYSLSMIEKKFSEFKHEIIKVRKEFETSFGKARINIERKMREYCDGSFESYQKETKNFIKEILEQQIIDKKMAKEYISEVMNRSNGENIPYDIKKTLLTYEYLNEPHGEFLNGYTQTYRTKGHKKSLGIDFQITVPESWLRDEGIRPHIIQKFTSENGRGMETVMLIAEKIPKEDFILLEKDIKELLTEEGMVMFLPEGCNYISIKEITIDGYKGGILEYEMITERQGIEVKILATNYITIIGRTIIHIQCMTGDIDDDKSANLEMNKFTYLFKLIGNSIEIFD